MESMRTLREPDLHALLDLCDAAGWNQTERDWRRLLSLAPEGCVGLEIDGALVSTATAVCYGDHLAWIGMVLTDPRWRGRGFGTRITARAIDHARRAGVRAVKLDATEMGRPVYLKLGFRDEGPIDRWSRAAAAPAGAPVAAAPGEAGAGCLPWEPDPVLDRAAFGADRSALLAALAGEGALTAPRGNGFAMARVGKRAVQLGPCVARSESAARALLAALAERHAGRELFWDLLPSNERAVRLARGMGFAQARRLTRMVLRGPAAELAHDDELVYAAAGFEYG